MQEFAAGGQPARQRSFVERMIGAARLDISVYEEVEHDRAATAQAAGVVAITALCSAVGAVNGRGFSAPMGVLVGSLMAWVIMAGLTYLIGTYLFSGTADMGELLRTIGFSRAPGVLAVLGIVPLVGPLIVLAVWVWQLVTLIVAIRQALDFDTGRAIATGCLAWLIPTVAIVAFIIFFFGMAVLGGRIAG